MWSVSISALEPNSVTAFPFTVTRPSTMSSSALRRLVTPAWDRSFCRRSSGMFRRRRVGRFEWQFSLWLGLRFANRQPPELLEFLQGRQLAQILQSKLHQELFGGLVKDGLADDALAPRFRDQLAVEQSLQD